MRTITQLVEVWDVLTKNGLGEGASVEEVAAFLREDPWRVRLALRIWEEDHVDVVGSRAWRAVDYVYPEPSPAFVVAACTCSEGPVPAWILPKVGLYEQQQCLSCGRVAFVRELPARAES